MIAEIDCLVQETEGTLPAVVASAPRYSLPQRIRSSYHAFWYWLGEGLEWSRGLYRERPVGQLTHLSGSQQARIALLRRQFDVRFEQHCAALTTLKSYDYLDILDQAWAAWGQPRPVGGVVHDVGASNFWYARALHAFFLPSALTGVEVEGHRIYYNGYSRHDYAQGYVRNLPQTDFVIADYAQYAQPADTIVAWYPFVTPAPVLAWRMPLAFLAPQALFERIATNLNPSGVFVMVNQGREEADVAADLCRQAGLRCESSCEVRVTLRRRRIPPVVSWWRCL
ncbi:MAG: hypothetical protein K2X00_16585 [Nitrospiraceae bacterium]|nr:hypothetical protein [Nitrospiraceae bacterium]